MTEPKIEIFCGNNIEVLKKYPDNYFDSIVTDVPYGLSAEPDAVEMLKAWIEHGYYEHESKSGFMGKEWDAFVPQPIFWKEAFRVLKSGGHVASFFGTRTYDIGVLAMRLAGFEVRDCVQWVFGVGFPKSLNIGKAIDKIQGNKRDDLGVSPAQRLNKPTNDIYEAGIRGKECRVTKGTSEWEGWGTQLKPAYEPIVICRKPISEKSIAENVLKHGTGAINIDASRIGFKSEADYKESTVKNQHEDFGTKPMTGNIVYGDYSMVQPKNYLPSGRFPSNIILSHHPDCVCRGIKKVKSDAHHTTKYNDKKTLYEGGWKDGEDFGNKFADENGEETIENWICVDGCPVKMMDEQSGQSKSSDAIRNNNRPMANAFGKYNPDQTSGFSDEGGAARFFYCAKASKWERSFGLDEQIGETRLTPMAGRGQGGLKCRKCSKWKNSGSPCVCDEPDFEEIKFNSQINYNTHPTVKPVSLMRYLVKLITPVGGTVLDAFNGSGTTGIACKVEGFNYVGIDIGEEYCEISRARISAWKDDDTMEIIKEQEKEFKDETQLNLFEDAE